MRDARRDQAVPALAEMPPLDVVRARMSNIEGRDLHRGGRRRRRAATGQALTHRVMSKDVTQLIITALERDRELYRQLLPPLFQQLKRLEGPQQPEGEPKQ